MVLCWCWDEDEDEDEDPWAQNGVDWLAGLGWQAEDGFVGHGEEMD